MKVTQGEFNLEEKRVDKKQDQNQMTPKLKLQDKSPDLTRLLYHKQDAHLFWCQKLTFHFNSISRSIGESDDGFLIWIIIQFARKGILPGKEIANMSQL